MGSADQLVHDNADARTANCHDLKLDWPTPRSCMYPEPLRDHAFCTCKPTDHMYLIATSSSNSMLQICGPGDCGTSSPAWSLLGTYPNPQQDRLKTSRKRRKRCTSWAGARHSIVLRPATSHGIRLNSLAHHESINNAEASRRGGTLRSRANKRLMKFGRHFRS